jgi:hypothetical protein
MTLLETLKQALDVLERIDQVDNDCDILSPSLCYALDESLTSLCQQIKLLESAEPVAWYDVGVNENIAAIVMIGGVAKHSLKSGTQLFTHPAPQPKAEPLTDDQIGEIFSATWHADKSWDATLFARAIEAAILAKQGGAA